MAGKKQVVRFTPEEYVKYIRQRFAEAGDPIRAEGQMKYMRNRYAYHGLTAPQWIALLKDIFAEHGKYEGAKLKQFASLCFREECREMFYAGLQMIDKQQKILPAEFIDFFEKAIVAGDWWDTVDWINKMVGIHFQNFPELQKPTVRKWIQSNNIWLQRVAILHQLKFKHDTDQKLLFEMILARKDSKEFFVQKGAGWALREYAKTKPEAVLAFVEKHPELAALTKREATKHLL